MMWKISACSVPWLKPAVCAQASLASVRLFEGNGVSLRVRFKINYLPTAAALVIFARSALHDLPRQSMGCFEAISGRWQKSQVSVGWVKFSVLVHTY